jgi:L-threonylcarbamoyladenylate synthase
VIDERALERALAALRAGEPIVMPTDTVYGIAARPSSVGAVGAVFREKRRARDKPLPVLAADVDDLRDIVVIDARVERIAADFWPGALTLVIPRFPEWRFDVGAGRDGPVAVRVPNCPVALALLRRSGPLAVTSANLSGRPPAHTVEEARAALGAGVKVFVDGGRRAGAPSTIVSLVGAPTVLRTGSLPPDEVVRLARRDLPR